MTHHGAGLRKLTKDDELVRQVAEDFREAPLDPADRAMLDFAVKLTRHPGRMEEADVERLREHGFDDAQVLSVVQVTAYYAFVNRIAQGLGVELERYWKDDEVLGRAEGKRHPELGHGAAGATVPAES